MKKWKQKSSVLKKPPHLENTLEVRLKILQDINVLRVHTVQLWQEKIIVTCKIIYVTTKTAIRSKKQIYISSHTSG